MTFAGTRAVKGSSDEPTIAVGALLSNQRFGGGTIEATLSFRNGEKSEAAALVLFYQAGNQSFVSAQLGGDFLCSLWSFVGNRWYPHGSVGSAGMLQPNRDYNLKVIARGSEVRFFLDGAHVLTGTLPLPLPSSQAGLWFRGVEQIDVPRFRVSAAEPTVFVVMQFTAPFNDLFAEVIAPVCADLGLRAERADDKFGPGVIIQDIEKQILEAQVVLAEITPRNPNVYYEVGFAHALKKPTILIAQSPTELPFDISPFRVLLYDNTISGKSKVEAGLRKHLRAIMDGTLDSPQ